MEEFNKNYNTYRFKNLINELSEEIYRGNSERGFWTYEEICTNLVQEDYHDYIIPIKNAFLSQKLALVHTEVSEAVEALRKDNQDNFKEELADIIIRVLDLCGSLDIDIGTEIINKLEKNSKRGHMHGGKKF